MKRILIWAVAIIVVLYIAVEAVIPPVVMHQFLDEKVVYQQLYRAEESGLPAPDTLHLTASDGMDLVAYKVAPAAPKAVVICLTGIQNPSVTCYWGHARMFYDAGYASILLEVRGHTPSGGERICAGYQEPRDVRAVTDYIKSRPELAQIPVVIMGISMGAGVAINSIAVNKDIDALVSISAYSSLEDFLVEFMREQAPAVLSYCIKPFVQFTSLCRYGVNPLTVRPKSAIRHLDGRPALLMHTRGDDQVFYTNFERIMRNAPDGVQTEVRDVNEHFFTPDFHAPQSDTLYCRRLMGFMTDAVSRTARK